MRVALLAVCLSASIAFAQSPVQTEIFALQQQIASIQQEQQTVFSSSRCCRRSSATSSRRPIHRRSRTLRSTVGTIRRPNYDDLVREKQAREDRIEQYTSDLNALFERHPVLEQQKQALLAPLRALTQSHMHAPIPVQSVPTSCADSVASAKQVIRWRDAAVLGIGDKR
jgi:hypothetical protein